MRHRERPGPPAAHRTRPDIPDVDRRRGLSPGRAERAIAAWYWPLTDISSIDVLTNLHARRRRIPARHPHPRRKAPMTDTIPTGAAVITPAADHDLEVGCGYLAETGDDFVYLTIHDRHRGPVVLVLTPSMARQVADTLGGRCDTLARLQSREADDA